LQSYNTALVKKSSPFFRGAGGTDYGGPVRAAATQLFGILQKDEFIRRARLESRSQKVRKYCHRNIMKLMSS